jgi:hypothetical protein
MTRPDDRAVMAGLVFVVLAITIALVWESSPRQVSDVNLYRTYGERIVDGRVPYRDFDVEYPPAALVVFALPAVLGGGKTVYGLGLVAMLALVGALAIVLVDVVLGTLGRARPIRNGTSLLLALTPIPFGAILLSRFDLVPAAIVLLALALLLAERPRWAGVVLGLAIAVKLYPAVALPVTALWVLRRAGRRAALEHAGLAVGVTLLFYLPFLLIAPGGVVHSVAHQASRPLQIESLGSSVLLAAHHIAGLDLEWSSGHGSQNLVGALPDGLAAFSSLLTLTVIVGIWWCVARARPDGEVLVRAVAAAVVAFVVLGKVFSPQFVIWALFLVPVVGGRSGRAAACATGLAAILTAVWFPLRYWSLVREFDPIASWALVGRNLSLVAALVLLVAPLVSAARERAPARSRSPAPLPGRT